MKILQWFFNEKWRFFYWKWWFPHLQNPTVQWRHPLQMIYTKHHVMYKSSLVCFKSTSFVCLKSTVLGKHHSSGSPLTRPRTFTGTRPVYATVSNCPLSSFLKTQPNLSVDVSLSLSLFLFLCPSQQLDPSIDPSVDPLACQRSYASAIIRSK